MRYVCMHKAGPSSESGKMPSQRLVEQMGQLVGEAAKKGELLGGDGLLPGGKRFKLVFQGANVGVTAGTQRGGNELPTRLTAIRVRTAEEGLEWAKRWGRALGAQELEMGQATESWDLGLCERPADAPVRFLLLPKATARTEAGEGLSSAQLRELAALKEEMTRKGVLTFDAPLEPSSKAVRLHYRAGVRTVTDGPFAESKELIGGFCLVVKNSLQEMLAFADRFAAIIDEDLEIDLRQAGEPSYGSQQPGAEAH
jgi:hypothetical protein